MKKRLLKILKSKQERKQALGKKANETESIEELRSINTELETLNAEIEELRSIIDAMPDEDPEGDDFSGEGEGEGESRSNDPIGGINVLGTYGINQSQQNQGTGDITDTTEYRSAFQQFVTRGTPIPMELRANESTLTTDVASAIPTVLVNKIVEQLESTGMILPLVTRTSFAAGINIPTSSVKPTATWVLEGQGSDRQKKTTSVITFTNFKLRCEISMSMEVGTMAISAFENAFVRQVVEAMVKAIEQAILNGNGTTQPKGILKETPATGQALDVTALDFDTLIDAEAALPQAYEEGAVWCMTKKTFMAFVGMTDENKQPIARINYGIGGKPERTLLGRTVILCGDYMDSYSASLGTGKIFAFLFNFSDYALNTIYDMGVQRKQDWDTEDMLTKAVMSVDGKVIDKNSLVVLKKKAE
jgi:HK97 family phage major capsid protein